MEDKTLVVLNNLPALADQLLKVSITIDPQGLREEVERHTGGQATRILAAKGLKIHDDASFAVAADLRNDFAKRESCLAKLWKRMKDPLNEVRGQILDLEKLTASKEKEGRDIVNTKMERYMLEQNRAKAEAEQRMAEVAAKQQKELKQEAEDLAAMGFMDQARAKVVQAQITVAPTLPDAVEKPANLRMSEGWEGKATDIISLMRAIVEGRVPLMHEVKGEQRAIVIVDQVVINELVRRQQNALNIPGITVTERVKFGSVRS